MTESEAYISIINSNFFFKEFTFSENQFKTDEKGRELELADNVVWLDDLLLITQIKERTKSDGSNSNNWFKNKILGKAVKQIKDTIKYFDIYSDILLENERGHVINISKAKEIKPLKLIVYSPDVNFPELNRRQKFYESSQVGLIHLFHQKDYLLICKYLITPFEIGEYLNFRESLFQFNGKGLNEYSEQYVLGHYIETSKDLRLNPAYIKNLTNIENDHDKFDISGIIENFQRVTLHSTGENHYYYVIKELAKLNRADLRAFRLRFDRVLNKVKNQEPDMPYRFTSINSNCGFVFIPLEFNEKNKWENILINCSQLHKYEQKLDRVVGMISYYNPEGNYHDIYWTCINSNWEYNEELEKIIENDFPLRSVKMEKIFRYYLKD